VEEAIEGYGTAKSCASRHFQQATAKQLQQLMEREVPKDLVALMVDAKHFADQCLVVALGITARGQKLVLGLWQGSTENTTVVKELLGDLVRRGLNPEQPLLVVLDGGKALAKAVGEVFGAHAVVQRCRVHKTRNVLDHLPKPMQAKFAWRLKTAWQLRDHREVIAEMERIARDLEKVNPSAARSLREGLEQTVTLQRLGVNELLRQSLSSTNLIESCFSQAEAFSGRVKYWRSGTMAPRWCASALLWSEKKFRRVRGHRHLGALQEALQKEILERKSQVA
jgi:transposase-like protein